MHGYIRRFLEAGMMSDGMVEPRRQGTPQGGPLSPLLSNILLTDLDRERERRGLSFVRPPMTATFTLAVAWRVSG
jgi:RNA-directed DNA polymerase